MPQPLSHLQAATRQAVVDGPGSTDSALRRQVASGQPTSELAILVQKIRDHAYKVTDDDIDALRAHYTEDQPPWVAALGELVSCASERHASVLPEGLRSVKRRLIGLVACGRVFKWTVRTSSQRCVRTSLS